MSIKVKEKAREKANKPALIMITVLLLLILATVTIYALFSSSTPVPYNPDTGTGTVDMNLVFTPVNFESGIIFKNKGDAYSMDLAVSNPPVYDEPQEDGDGVLRPAEIKNYPFLYTFVLDLRLPERSAVNPPLGLENATFVYFDGQFLGTLAALADENGKIEIAVFAPLAVGESFTHRLSFEYHIGANDYFTLSQETGFSVTVNAKARQLLSADKYVFVSNFYELNQIINHYVDDTEGLTVQFADDIVLEDNLTAAKPFNIDLAGHTLDLNGKTFTFAFSGAAVSSVRSGRAGGNVLGVIGADTPESYVWSFTELDVISADMDGVLAAFDAHVREVTKEGVTAVTDFAGGLASYIAYYAESGLFVFDCPYITYDILQKRFEITEPMLPDMTTLKLTADGAEKSYTFKIFGRDADAIADAIIEKSLSYLVGNIENREDAGDEKLYAELRGDIKLPSVDKAANAKILWISGNRQVLTEAGKVNIPGMDDSYFELTAIFTVNGQNVMRTFNILVRTKTPEEKLREIISIFGVLYFTQLMSPLDIPDEDLFREFGLISLDFRLPPEAESFFRLDKTEKKLELIRDTSLTETYLEVIAEFNNSYGETVSGKILVYIDLQSNVSYWEAAYRDLLIYLADSGLNEKIMTDFELPENYKDTATYSYIIRPGKAGAETELVNPSNVNDYANIANGTEIILDYDKLPSEDTWVTVEVVIEYEGKTELRYFRFMVCGVIHFEDINLLQEIRKAYLAAENRKEDKYVDDWTITREEADNCPFTSFTAEYHNIESLVGLEYFTKLKYLNLSNNWLTDLTPISGLTNLESLILSGNRLVNADDLKGLTLLNYLDLSNNYITDIASLSNNIGLQSLNLSGNQLLSDISAVTGLPALFELRLAYTAAADSFYSLNVNTVLTIYQTALAAGRTPAINLTGGANLSPSANELTANTIVNTIVPIYEFYNVIYMPPTVRYGTGANDYCNITWNTNRTDIVQFDGTRAYVTVPIADIDVRISAGITYGGATITKYFKVISRGDHSKSLTVAGMVLDARTAIPDETLRYHLFRHFDVNGDGNITASEISSRINNPLDLSGAGITDLTGIGYFSAGISVLHLQNNDINGFGELGSLTGLRILTLNNTNNGLDFLLSLTGLTQLNVYGLKNVNSDESLSVLYQTYKRNAGIEIYKDSADSVWNPYIALMEKALKNLESIYVLRAGASSIQLQNTLDVTMYDGTVENYTVYYWKFSNEMPATLDANAKTLGLTWANMPSIDTHEMIQAGIYINEWGLRYLEAISVYETDICVELSGGGYEYLTNAVPNESARRAFIRSITSLGSGTLNGKSIRYIRISDYTRITDISFDGFGMYGLKGLDLFLNNNTVSSLQTLNITGYIPTTGDSRYFDKYKGLNILEPAYFPNLRNISIRNSVVDLFEMTNIAPQISSLILEKNTKVVMDITEGGLRQSVFEYFTSLVTLNLIECNIRDFWAIKELRACRYLKIYDNDNSTTDLTDYYVGKAYANLAPGTSITYYVVSATRLWEPKDIDVDELAVTIMHGSVSETAKYGVAWVNYVNAGDRLDLPLAYRSLDENVRWTPLIGSALLLNPSVTSNVRTATFGYPAGVPNYVSAYVVLKGEVFNPSDPDTVFYTTLYVFIIKQPKITVGGNNYLDLNDFADKDFTLGGKLVDPGFAYCLLIETMEKISPKFREIQWSSVQEEYMNAGMFVLNSVAGCVGVYERYGVNLSVYASNNGVRLMPSVVFTSIKGIKNFKSVTYLEFCDHSVTDIGELYYLTNLQTFAAYRNRIHSLRTVPAGQTSEISIFYNMHQLESLNICMNSGINDFRPITERASASYLQKLRSIEIFQEMWDIYEFILSHQEGEESDPNAEYTEGLYVMARAWWNERQNHPSANDSRLHMVYNQDFNGTDAINGFFLRINALKAVSTRSVSVGDILTSTSGGYTVYWDANFTAKDWAGRKIYISDSGQVISIAADLQYATHPYKMRIYIKFDHNGRTSEISRSITVTLTTQGSFADDNLRVELTDTERRTYAALYNIPANQFMATGGQGTFENYRGQSRTESLYTVRASYLIPDNFLRMKLFYKYAGADGILSLAERGSEYGGVTSWDDYMFNTENGGGTGGWGYISDIRGFELMYNCYYIQFYMPRDMREFPCLPIRSSRFDNMNIHKLSNFVNISEGFSFDADALLGGANDDYASLFNKLVELNMENSHLDDIQLDYIAKMPNLGRLGLNDIILGDMNVLYPITTHNTRLGMFAINLQEEYRKVANDNQNAYKRMVLDSRTTNQIFGGPVPRYRNYYTQIISDFLKTEEYPKNARSPLPKSFKIPNYDREYTVNWYVADPDANPGLLPKIPDGGYTDAAWEEVKQYCREHKNYYSIDYDAANGLYFITIGDNAPNTIPVVVRVSFVDETTGQIVETYYREIIELMVISNDFDLSNQYYATEGYIWVWSGTGELAATNGQGPYTRQENMDGWIFTSNYMLLSDVIPDAIMRYYFLKYVDKDKDGYITWQEIIYAENRGTWSSALEFKDANTIINSLEGVQTLFNTAALAFSYVYTYDFEPLVELSNMYAETKFPDYDGNIGATPVPLQFFTLEECYLVLRDTLFLEKLTNMEGIAMYGSGLVHYNFLKNNEKLKEFYTITGRWDLYNSPAQQALFTKDALAFARLYHELNDRSYSYLANTEYYINTWDEKWAALYLTAIAIPMKENPLTSSGYDFNEVFMDGNTLELPSEISFEDYVFFATEEKEGYDGILSYKSLSHNLEIQGDAANGYTLVLHDDPVNELFWFVARITYNGAVYERLFTVRCPLEG